MTPEDYTVRVSARARTVRLKVHPFKGLEVVIPKRFPRRNIPGILQQHQHWITRQLQRVRNSRLDVVFPDTLCLHLTNERYRIERVNVAMDRIVADESRLRLPSDNDEQAYQLLRRFIRKQARRVLPNMLADVAVDCGMNYQRLTIRSQKTRWGSCSSRGSISLNDQCLFLPPDTVRYLMIHELCHTRFMNHSAAFWSLVGRHCADYRDHESILNRPDEFVPEWYRFSLFNGLS